VTRAAALLRWRRIELALANNSLAPDDAQALLIAWRRARNDGVTVEEGMELRGAWRAELALEDRKQAARAIAWILHGRMVRAAA
jgi:hypothetical protein